MSTLDYPKNPHAAAWLRAAIDDGYRTDQEREAARILLPAAGMPPDKPSPFFRHVDGGLYYYLAEVKHADTDEPHIVYEHLWPFPPERRVRLKTEWERRFTRVSSDEFIATIGADRTKAQTAVTEAKAKRRATEANDPPRC